MELTNGQKKKIRGIAQRLKADFQIGKNDINEEMLKAIFNGLEANELVKIHLLNNTQLTKEEALTELQTAIEPDYAYVIGKQIVLFKRSSKKEKRDISAKL